MKKKEPKGDSPKRAWTEKDFVTSLDKVMKEQETANPPLKRLHAQLDPKFREILNLINQLLLSNETDETVWIEKIVSYKTKALYPLIESLLALKRTKNSQNPL